MNFAPASTLRSDNFKARRYLLAVALSTLFAPQALQAASQNWTGGSVANGEWGTVANWSGDAAPGSTAVTNNTDVATFNAAIANTWGNAVGNPIVINSTSQNIGGLSFTLASGNYFIGSTGGNTLRLTSAGTIQILSGLTATNAIETINSPLSIQTANGTYTFANNSANGAGAGAGTLNFGGQISGAVAGATVLTLNGTNTNSNTISGNIVNGTATSLAIFKSGTGSWTLSGANTYSGGTNINGGKLIIGATNTLPTTGTVTLNSAGSGSTPATLELVNFNQTIGILNVQNTATTAGNADTISIGSGRTLTANGNVTIGRNADASSTFATISGLGSFNVTNSGGTFQVGGAVSASFDNAATLDMSGLSNFTANLGTTGTFRVGVTSSAVEAGNVGASTAILAKTSVITAGTISLGSDTYHASLQTLKLGDTANTINANTINLSLAALNGRGSGAIVFNSGTGTLKIRSATDPVNGRANLNLGNTSQGGAAPVNATVDLTGHNSDLLLGALVIANRSSNNSGVANGTFSYDAGIFNVTSIDLALRTVGTGTSTGTLNIGGGTNTIGTLTMATATTGNSATADFNLSGGTNAITSIAMSSSGGGTSNATINLTGSSVTTLGGNITRTGGAGVSNATINLDGGTLNMGGFNIGAANAVTFNAKAGTLRNLAELNSGGTLSKSTTGTLILDGTNGYTGATAVTAGIVNVRSSAGLGNVGAGTTVSAGATLQLQGTITVGAEALTLNGGNAAGQNGALVNVSGTNNYGGLITLATVASTISSDTGILNLTNPGMITGGFGLTLAGPGNGSIDSIIATGTNTVTKTGTGTWTLNGANTYSGTTTVNGGILKVEGAMLSNHKVLGSNFIAAPDDSFVSGAFNPILDRRILATATYADLGSTSNGGLNSTAELLAGTASSNADVSMQWRTRTTDETTGTPTTPRLISNVLDLSGVAIVSGSTTDLFALQMNYDPTGATGGPPDIYLGTFDTDTSSWVNAVATNKGTNNAAGLQIGYLGTFASFQTTYGSDLNTYRGAWGVDVSSKVAWAVLDHNSEFAVIPEPSTLVFGGLALLGFAGAGLRKRRMAKPQA